MTDIVADIGGTNARFAVSEKGVIGTPIQLYCADFETFEDALHHVTSALNLTSKPHRLCLAIAGTVDQDEVQLSNNHWGFSKQALKAALGLDALTVINDFTAQALGVTTLDLADETSSLYRVLRAGKGDKNTPIAVLGPGTGLGFSALIPAQNHMLPLETEGGQIGLAAQTPAEEQLLMRIRKSHAADEQHHRLVAEDVLSGRGLVCLFNHLGEQKLSENEAAQISAMAHNNIPQAKLAIQYFLDFLGNYIASAILHIGARQGVFICGGITPKLLPFLSSSAFYDRIEKHDKFSDFIGSVPVYLMEDSYSGLRGAAAALDNPSLAHRRI